MNGEERIAAPPQLGSRLIDSTSKKLASQFFTKFNEVVSAKAAGVQGESSAMGAVYLTAVDGDNQ